MVTRDRDVQAFHDRASGYETGYRGRLHTDIVTRAVDIALAHCPSPDRILDVGCGTGMALRELARRLPGAATLTGIDAASGMIAQARAAECHRVLEPRGSFVLADMCSSWLLPTLAGGRRDRARTPLRATKLLAAAGFRSLAWHRLYGGIIRAVTASA